MSSVVDPVSYRSALRMRTLLARHSESREMVALGMYKPGGDPELDEAIAKHPQITAFLQQSSETATGLNESLEGMRQLVDAPAHPALAGSEQVDG